MQCLAAGLKADSRPFGSTAVLLAYCLTQQGAPIISALIWPLAWRG